MTVVVVVVVVKLVVVVVEVAAVVVVVVVMITGRTLSIRLILIFTAQVPPTRAVTYWDNEKYDYDYDTNTCTDFCGHYTQVSTLI